jgi:hypothetical protein
LFDPPAEVGYGEHGAHHFTKGTVMQSKLRVGAGLCFFLAAIAAQAGGVKTETLNIGDVHSDLRVLQGTPLDAVSTLKITYAVTGDPAYDEFFMTALVAELMAGS